MKRFFIAAAAVAAMSSSMEASIVTLWESESPEGVQIGWGTMIGEAVVSAEKCADYQVGDKILLTVASYDTELDAWPQVRITSPLDGWPVICAPQVLNDKPMPTVITFEIDEDVLEVMQEEGYFPSGNACWISKMELESESVTPDEPEIPSGGATVIWESATADGEAVGWGHQIPGTIVSPEECASYNAGDAIEITVVRYDTELDAWPQVGLKAHEDGWPALTATQVMNDKDVPYVMTFELDEDTVEWAKECGFFPSGTACWISRMVYVPAGVSSGVDEMVSEEDSVVDVYNMQGMVVKSRVDSSAALDGLRPGVYIVGGKKVLVR